MAELLITRGPIQNFSRLFFTGVGAISSDLIHSIDNKMRVLIEWVRSF